jgi:hypothetical protein
MSIPKKPILLMLLIHVVIIIVVSIILLFPIVNICGTTPFIEIVIFFSLFIISYILGSVICLKSELRLHNKHKFYSRQHLFWFLPNRFKVKYLNLSNISLLYSIFITSFVFLVSVIALSLIVGNTNKSNSQNELLCTELAKNVELIDNNRISEDTRKILEENGILLTDNHKIINGINPNNVVVYDNSQIYSIFKRKDKLFTYMGLIENNTSNDFLFVFNEGIIVVFIFAFFTVWTFLTASIHKLQSGREIIRLNDLHELISMELKSTRWEKVSEKFIYIIDYSAATGHRSSRRSFFNYINTLHNFLQKYNSKFAAIVLKKKDLFDNYMREFYKEIQQDYKTIKDNCKWIYDANDSFFHLLNLPKQNTENPFKVYYFPFRESKHQTKRDVFKRNDSHTLENPKSVIEYGQNMIDVYKNKINQIKTDNNFEQIPINIVLYTESLGLTRLIVTNRFVVQFLAVQERNRRNEPIGFISHDIVMIERYKRAFETFFLLMK